MGRKTRSLRWTSTSKLSMQNHQKQGLQICLQAEVHQILRSHFPQSLTRRRSAKSSSAATVRVSKASASLLAILRCITPALTSANRIVPHEFWGFQQIYKKIKK